MKTEELRQAILDLNAEERLNLMWQLGPEMCRAFLQQPAMWEQMMARCRADMDSMGMPEAIRTAMADMMARMAGTATAAVPQAAPVTPGSLDPVTRELVALAAAVAGHCGPCFAHHHKEAQTLAITPQLIQEVISLARQIRAAGDRHHDEFIARRMAGPDKPNRNASAA